MRTWFYFSPGIAGEAWLADAAQDQRRIPLQRDRVSFDDQRKYFTTLSSPARALIESAGVVDTTKPKREELGLIKKAADLFTGFFEFWTSKIKQDDTENFARLINANIDQILKIISEKAYLEAAGGFGDNCGVDYDVNLKIGDVILARLTMAEADRDAGSKEKAEDYPIAFDPKPAFLNHFNFGDENLELKGISLGRYDTGENKVPDSFWTALEKLNYNKK